MPADGCRDIHKGWASAILHQVSKWRRLSDMIILFHLVFCVALRFLLHPLLFSVWRLCRVLQPCYWLLWYLTKRSAKLAWKCH